MSMNPRQGRSRDVCPCNSGRRYQSCCDPARLYAALPKPIVALDCPLLERNRLLLDGLEQILGKESNVHNVKEKITPATVCEIYKLIAAVFPRGSSIESIVPEPSTKLRSLYLSHVHPMSIVQNVVRYSLYCDEILVPNPFPNPCGLNPKYNPLFHPQEHMQTTLRNVVAVMLLKNWIRCGFVLMVPDPGVFDSQLRKGTWALAEQRLKGKPMSMDDAKQWETELRSDMERYTLTIPRAFSPEALAKAFPEKSPEEINKIMLARDKLIDGDPLALPRYPKGQLTINVSNNLEMSSFICQASNAFPYTNIPFRWKEILGCLGAFPKQSSTWSPLTEAFQKLELAFLDSVDPAFAEGLRQDGRLSSFRSFLLKIWQEVSKNPDTSTSNGMAFRDELIDEYRKAQAELDKIQADISKSGGLSIAALIGGSGAGFATGHMEIVLGGLGAFIVKGVSDLLGTTLKSRAFAKSVPMSVFIDLSNAKPWRQQ